MSFLSAIPVIALLAMLPVLLSLRPVAGVREFSASCALSAASAGALTVAAALQAPVAAMFGYAGLAVALFFVLQGLRRVLALSIPASLCLVLAFSSGVLGFIIALAGCFQGMLVQGNSEEVGMRTTTAVVQSIFMVIVLDAMFTVFFSSVGWK